VVQARTWSAESVPSGTPFEEEVDLVFTIRGQHVRSRADVLEQVDANIWVDHEAKWSELASYADHQRIVIPELIRAGDRGLQAIVRYESKNGLLRRGGQIQVLFQGDVWTGGPRMLGQ
jgi:hypothetical protein